MNTLMLTFADAAATTGYASDFVSWAVFGACIGAALAVIGAGYGISKIASSSVESMARQPEVAGQINTAMIITAALIEGVALFGVVVCFQINGSIETWIKAALTLPH